MKEYQKGKPEEMTDEQVTRFIEERLQLLEKTGQINEGAYDRTEEETRPPLLNFLKKMFRGKRNG